MNKFQKWLENFGVVRLATHLDVTPHSVNRWRRGDGWPTVGVILEIVRLAKGALTVEDVIEWTCLKANRPRQAWGKKA